MELYVYKLCVGAQTGSQVFAMAKVQPKKAAKTVQKKAATVGKVARKTVRCAYAARCLAHCPI